MIIIGWSGIILIAAWGMDMNWRDEIYRAVAEFPRAPFNPLGLQSKAEYETGHEFTSGAIQMRSLWKVRKVDVVSREAILPPPQIQSQMEQQSARCFRPNFKLIIGSEEIQLQRSTGIIGNLAGSHFNGKWITISCRNRNRLLSLLWVILRWSSVRKLEWMPKLVKPS